MDLFCPSLDLDIFMLIFLEEFLSMVLARCRQRMRVSFILGFAFQIFAYFWHIFKRQWSNSTRLLKLLYALKLALLSSPKKASLPLPPLSLLSLSLSLTHYFAFTHSQFLVSLSLSFPFLLPLVLYKS